MDVISKPIREDKWLSLPQAAALLGKSRQTVTQMAALNELESDHVAGRLVIGRESVLAKKKQLDEEAAQAGVSAA